MTNVNLFSDATDIYTDDYCVFGLATCFFREEGEISQVEILEPIPSAALEALIKGIPTSYQKAVAKTLGEVFTAETVKIPVEFPENTKLCEEFNQRVIAATRTYKRRTEAKSHIPLGTVYDKFNYSIQKKRLLNMENVVTTDDNVKQHKYTHEVL
jgi:hypothetical protein